MTPQEIYDDKVKNKSIVTDSAQLVVISYLNDIHDHLVAEYKSRNGMLSWLRKPGRVRGIYLWGGVGIGKTMMMDCFYQSIPFENKLRMHFHPFMRMIHRELKRHQGEKNPLSIIAADLAKKYILVCFDEFFVTDITDAMLLARLFEALFVRGVTLVATSNVMPDELYKRGLQRDQFIPAIELIKQHTLVCHIPATQDYRLRHLSHAGVFFVPNDPEATKEMQRSFEIISDGDEIQTDSIELCGREVSVVKKTGRAVWFDFRVLCSPPRSQNDYLEIAERYSTVFMSDVTSIPAEANDRITLFIKLIDILYDNHVRLVMSSEVPIDELYTHGRMLFEYTRACSRLFEMQSEDYL